MIALVDSFTSGDGSSREKRRSETSISFEDALERVTLLLEFAGRAVAHVHMATMQKDDFSLRIQERGRNTGALFVWEFRCDNMEEFRDLLEAAYYGSPADGSELRKRMRFILELSGIELADIESFPWADRGACATVNYALRNGVRDSEEIKACRDVDVKFYEDFREVFAMWKEQDQKSLASMLKEWELA